MSEHVGDEDVACLARIPPLQPCFHELPGTGERREPRNGSRESRVVLGVERTENDSIYLLTLMSCGFRLET